MKAPWHLWIVGVVGLIWHLGGGLDYSLTQYDYGPYMEQFTDEQRVYFDSFPTWVVATWASAIWLSVLGSVLLLMRSRGAVLSFGVALICVFATDIYNYLLADQPMHEVVGQEAIWFGLAIVAVAIFHWLYARALYRRGVLA